MTSADLTVGEPVATTTAELVARAAALAQPGRRVLLGIVGGPGAGKSTVSDALLAALGDRAVVVGMDGFHLGQAELVRLGRADRKGSPDTFDTDGYAALLRRLAAQRPGDPPVYAPVFDRALEEPIGSSTAVRAEVPLVITEGNWLLSDGHGWEAVRPLLAETWFVGVDADERRRRLIARRLGHGHPRAAAEAWVREVDEPNAALVDATAIRADLILTLPDRSPAATTPSRRTTPEETA